MTKKRKYLLSMGARDREDLNSQIKEILNKMTSAKEQLNNEPILSSKYDELSREVRNCRIKLMSLRIRLENLGKLSEYEVKILNKINII